MKLGWRIRQKDAPLGVVVGRATSKIAETVGRIPAADDGEPMLRRQQPREISRARPDMEHLKKSRLVDQAKNSPPLTRVKRM